jgi:hypothetical protein
MLVRPGNRVTGSAHTRMASRLVCRERKSVQAATCRAWELPETRMALDILAYGARSAVMPFSLVILAGCDRAERRLSRFLANHEKSGAFGTGSWTDTSPQAVMCTLGGVRLVCVPPPRIDLLVWRVFRLAALLFHSLKTTPSDNALVIECAVSSVLRAPRHSKEEESQCIIKSWQRM